VAGFCTHGVAVLLVRSGDRGLTLGMMGGKSTERRVTAGGEGAHKRERRQLISPRSRTRVALLELRACRAAQAAGPPRCSPAHGCSTGVRQHLRTARRDCRTAHRSRSTAGAARAPAATPHSTPPMSPGALHTRGGDRARHPAARPPSRRIAAFENVLAENENVPETFRTRARRTPPARPAPALAATRLPAPDRLPRTQRQAPKGTCTGCVGGLITIIEAIDAPSGRRWPRFGTAPTASAPPCCRSRARPRPSPSCAPRA
jgi:hypothetical protein